MFAQSYLNTSVQIIKEYKGDEPLASFLKKFFAAHKKYGSRDRKQIMHLCYCYFRLGKSLMHISVEEKILAGLYLCDQTNHPLLASTKPEWNETVANAKEAKIEVLHRELGFNLLDIFPFHVQLSPEIELTSFIFSFLYQPDTYLRIRPGMEIKVKQKLAKAAVPFRLVTDNCIAVAPSTKLETILQINKEVVVQDASSQTVLTPLKGHVKNNNQKYSVWDCCAASGGKSILLKDNFLAAQLTVSDIRDSILANLRKRFYEAGITSYKWFVADVSSPKFTHDKIYDLVICDAPCSGAGTWARTPEQLYFFEKEKISHYTSLQQKIVLNASRNVKKNGMFLYITCSVFKDENEGIVEFIQQNSSLQLEAMQYISGYKHKSDSLFVALFVKK